MSLVQGPWDKEVVSAEIAGQGPAVIAASREFFVRIREAPHQLNDLWAAVRKAVPNVQDDFLNRTFWDFFRGAKVHREFEIAWTPQATESSEWLPLGEDQLDRLSEVWPEGSGLPIPNDIALRFVGYIEQRGWDLKVEKHIRERLRRHFAGQRLGLTKIVELVTDVLGEEQRSGEARAVALSSFRRWARGEKKTKSGKTMIAAVPCSWLSVIGQEPGEQAPWEPLTEDFIDDLAKRWDETSELESANELAWFLPTAEVPELDPAQSGSVKRFG
jgi:hypothetical protein